MLQVTRQAPETSGTPAQGKPDEDKRDQRSKREWLDSSGEHGRPDDAVAVKYTFLEDGKSYTYAIGQITSALDRMVAGFGGLTLMGNIANTWIHEKGERSESPVEDIEARWALLEKGEWIERGAGGVGAKVNKDALAEAVYAVMTEAGKTVFKDGAPVDKADIRQRLEDDDKGVLSRTWRQVTAIAARYAELAGRSTKSVDDI